jgi:DNA invertase Pin-like site-specific DNA recombinase
METKIQAQHTTKLAYVYLRQSTMTQVRLNQESTQRQYALQHKAQQLGWPQHAIRILDGDLGMSGAQSNHREDFKMLVADVSMAKVGAVFALEASRLSRSCTDWHRLLELCALTGTLIIDEDGCYNPADFNDQLLLGLKGTMSQAELHFIRARLQGGKNNKAKKGELRFPLPVGFCYDDENCIRFDSDDQVRSIIQLLFKAFKETGSAYGIVHHFRKENLPFPKRAYGGIWKGKLIWGTLTHSRAIAILKNPSYAGAYVYGRYQYQKKLSSTGQLQVTTVCLPMDSWNIVIKDHHEAYISWEEYLVNQEILKNNRTNEKENMLPTVAREGLALLQGLLICGCCGHKLTVRYKGNGGIYPIYECNWQRREGLETKPCVSVRADRLDQAMEIKLLEAINPAQINIAIEAFEELEQRCLALDKQWLMKIERADYEAQLAQRRYEEVDPSNRLVAGTLEKRWNDALFGLEEIRFQFEDYQKKNMLIATSMQRDKIQSLAKDLPRLWKSASTSAKDRKRILRLLIKDITVEKINSANTKKAILHIRWQGGAVEDLEIELPKKPQDKWRHSDSLVEQVKQLAMTMTDEEIANKFNQEALKTNKGNTFTVNSVQWIRFKHKIPSPRLNQSNEYSINQVATKFNISHHVVRYWIEHGIINARRIGSKLWILLDAEKETELRKVVERSTKIAIAREKSLNQTEGSVL